jgi:signal transduction histidine kinase
MVCSSTGPELPCTPVSPRALARIKESPVRAIFEIIYVSYMKDTAAQGFATIGETSNNMGPLAEPRRVNSKVKGRDGVNGDTSKGGIELILLILFLALAPLPAARGAATVALKRIIVLYSNSRLVPGNVEVDRGLRAALTSHSAESARIFSEFLDSPEFNGDAYEELMISYLHGKYATPPPDVMVVIADDALSFAVRHRAKLFPSVPIVYAVASSTVLHSLGALPDDIVGIPNEYDYSGTIRQALLWHPAARRLVIITGTSPRDLMTEARLRREVPAVVGIVTAEYWSGLTAAALQDRLTSLGADSVVFTPGFFQDGGGNQFVPRDAAALVAHASSAPVYGPFDTFIGTGVVGGRMPSFEKMGFQAGRQVDEILAGSAPNPLQLPKTTPTALNIDWRQARRWGIAPKSIPSDTVVYFKDPTIWEAHRITVLFALAVFSFQMVLITAFYLERRRRAAAELTTRRIHTELAHASRLAVAGELTASIAHEINQPLGAVQMSADAADMILQAGEGRREDLLRIVTRIRHDILRASDVIRRLRALLARHEPERRSIDVGLAITDAAMILRPEAERRKIVLDARSAAIPCYIAGDRTQIQQVLINLVLNAMDAMKDLPEHRRRLEVLIQRRSKDIVVTVQDGGHGIAPEDLPKLFDSFFSTKQGGMGLGLSIARSIVEAHGGRIWAQNREFGGAAFYVELPSLSPDSAQAVSPP